jgi:aspartate-semialdehyde dehydrogenase
MYTKEEMKMVNEGRKIMHHPALRVSCTCVRVPVMRAHSESLNMEFENEITPDEARAILSKAPGVTVVDDPANKRRDKRKAVKHPPKGVPNDNPR